MSRDRRLCRLGALAELMAQDGLYRYLNRVQVEEELWENAVRESERRR